MGESMRPLRNELPVDRPGASGLTVAEVRLNVIYKSSFYIKENTGRLHYKDKL